MYSPKIENHFIGFADFNIKVIQNNFIQKGTAILMVHPDDMPLKSKK